MVLTKASSSGWARAQASTSRAGQTSAAAPEIVDRALRPATYAAIEQQVDEMLAENVQNLSPLEEMERVVEAIPNEFVRKQALGLLDGLGLSTDRTLSATARETLIKLGRQAADAALNGAVYRTAHAIFYTLAFSAVVFLLRRVMRALLVLRKLPVLKQADQALGLVAGLAKGALLVWLAAWIIPFLVEVPPEVREGSFLLRHTTFVTQGPLMAKLFSLPGIGGKASL